MSEDQEGQGSKRPTTERADELLNRAGWTAGLFASMIGVRLARVAAFAREEAEDLWAEAQAVRHSSTVTEADQGVRTRTSEGTAVSSPEARSEAAEPDGEVETEAPPADAGDREQEKVEPRQSSVTGEESIKATPTARQRAEELGVDLREVEGTGSSGQITVGDVKKKAQAES
jgi:pyruvate/2-oxoglutarate dehydrogenase complex dihydrolipoamide acyltransferase (E2) component